jgi:hypothetical protein
MMGWWERVCVALWWLCLIVSLVVPLVIAIEGGK